MMNKNSKTYEVKPEYFYPASSSILILDCKTLTDFLNYSKYKVDVMSYDNTKETGDKKMSDNTNGKQA